MICLQTLLESNGYVTTGYKARYGTGDVLALVLPKYTGLVALGVSMFVDVIEGLQQEDQKIEALAKLLLAREDLFDKETVVYFPGIPWKADLDKET